MPAPRADWACPACGFVTELPVRTRKRACPAKGCAGTLVRQYAAQIMARGRIPQRVENLLALCARKPDVNPQVPTTDGRAPAPGVEIPIPRVTAEQALGLGRLQRQEHGMPLPHGRMAAPSGAKSPITPTAPVLLPRPLVLPGSLTDDPRTRDPYRRPR
jgi:hypothetical protein